MNLSIKAFGLKNYLSLNNISEFNLDDIVSVFSDGISSVTSAVHELERNDIIYKDSGKEQRPKVKYFVKNTKTELTENLLLELGFERQERWSKSKKTFQGLYFTKSFNSFSDETWICKSEFEIKANGLSPDINPLSKIPIATMFYFEYKNSLGMIRNIDSLEDLKVLFYAITGQNL